MPKNTVNICSIISKNNQTIFQERFYKQIAVIFLAQHRNHKYNFAQSSFPIYPRQKTVSVNIPHSIGIMLQIFYRILLLNNLKILVSVMLLNPHIVLFTCFNWMPITTSPSLGVAKVYLRQHQQVDNSKAIKHIRRDLLNWW